jgi:4-amino-4-deoxy-L-arabinose transferase-like glycosyltransferase
MRIIKSVLSFIKNNFAATIFCLLLFIFICSASFFALKLKPGIIPDEPEHFILSKQFSISWGIPADSPQTYAYGPIGQRPIVYYWINGRIINILDLFIDHPSDREMLVTLRFLNIFYSILTIVFCYLLAKEIINSPWWQLLVVFLLTNTLMFVFLSGGVNYDNLTNLCSFAGIYFLIRVFNEKHFYINSLGWLICIGLGVMVKMTILPIAAITILLWILYITKNRTQINSHLVFDWKLICLLIIFFAMALLNFSTYGMNILKYKTLFPECGHYLSEEQCALNTIGVKEKQKYLPEKLTYLDVIRDGYPDPIEWFFDFWIARILVMNYGIFGHQYYFPDLAITFYRVLIISIMFIMVRHWKKPSFAIGSLISISIFYTIILLRTNYDAELTTGFKHIAIQGRYIFPVIGVIYILMVHYLSIPPNTFMRRAVIYFTMVLFLWGSWVSPLSASFLHLSELTFLPITNIPAEQPSEEIAGPVEITQDFTSQCHGTIENVTLQFVTYKQDNLRPVTFKLIDLQGNRVIAEQTISGNTIKDNDWHSFIIPPLTNSIDKVYRISITSPESQTGNAVKIWSSTSDSYSDGQAMLNGKPTGNDINFIYQCIQPAFANWFQ